VSFAFYLSGIVQYVIDYRSQNQLPPISVAWQIPQIGLMTVAEILISVTGKLRLSSLSTASWQ
jgi:dipeptide/tripeptide permease